MSAYYLDFVIATKTDVSGKAITLSQHSTRSIARTLKQKKPKPYGLAFRNNEISLVYYLECDSVFYAAALAGKILTKFLDPLVSQFDLAEPKFKISLTQILI